MNCLTKIIGLTAVDTDCLPEDINNESLSGLWVDDATAGRIPLLPTFWKQTDYMYGMVDRATSEALNLLKMTLSKKLNKRYHKHQTVIGYKDDWTNYLPTSADWRYMVIKPQTKSKGLSVKIESIRIYLETKILIKNFEIIKGGQVIYSGAANFAPLTLALDEPIIICYKESEKPKNFKHRGCCGKQGGYSGWVSVGSGTTNDKTKLTNWSDSYFVNDEHCQGIEMGLRFDCDPLQDFCSVDFATSGFGYSFAYLVQLIARKNLAFWLMTNEHIQAYTIAKEDELKYVIDYLQSEIDITLNYLPETYDLTDCYICNGIYKGEILI